MVRALDRCEPSCDRVIWERKGIESGSLPGSKSRFSAKKVYQGKSFFSYLTPLYIQSHLISTPSASIYDKKRNMKVDEPIYSMLSPSIYIFIFRRESYKRSLIQ